jgi:hypothetical protein
MNPEKNEPKLPVPGTKQAETPPEILAGQGDDYGFDNVEHELVSRYQPKFLAKGGEHIVYEVPGHPDIVVKLETGLLKEIIEWNLERGQPIDSLPAELKPRVSEYLEQEAACHQQLKRYFGVDHVPGLKEFLVKIPITRNILNALYEGNPPAATDKVWGVVMIQKRAEALNDPNRLVVLSGYVEDGKAPEDLDNEATRHFVFGKSPEERIEKEKLFKIKSHGNLRVFLEKLESDEDLRELLKELVEKIITYTEETGEILDLAGQDNVVLFQKDGKWTYELVDASFSGGNKMFKKTKTTLLKFSDGSEIGEQEKHILLNVFCFIWTVNGLAEQVGAQKRINIVPDGMKREVMDLLR